MGNRKRIWMCVVVVFVIMAAVSGGLYIWLNGSTSILRQEPVSTGVQNRIMEYDVETDILFMGTYQNKLIAYRNQEKLWELEAGGPFCSLKICSANGYLYAACEDNHIYIINPEDGALVQDIQAGKRINDMDVSSDGSLIVLSASTGKMKHYLILVDSTGKEMLNEKLASKAAAVSFNKDDSQVVVGNNRGEIIARDLSGNEIARFTGSYPVIDMSPSETREQWLVLFGNASYALVDEDMKPILSSKPEGIATVTPTTVSMDAEQEYIFFGTEERLFYVISMKDESAIYNERMSTAISDILETGGKVYITGLGDWVSSLNVAELRKAEAAGKILPVLNVALPVILLLTIVCLLMTIGKTRKALAGAAKKIWRFRVAYLLLIPIFLLLIFFKYVPVGMAFLGAFTNWSKDTYTLLDIEFVGLDNFRRMISEGYFLTGLGNLVILMITGFIKVLTVPVLVAYLVYSMRSNRKKYGFRFLLVLPVVVPSVVSAMLWKQIYDPTIGLLNQFLGKIGLENLQRVWLGDEKLALWAIIFMGFPFVNAMAFLVFYGGFMDIDAAMIEAARIDGASRWKMFWSIQIPMIRPQIKMILILTFISTVQDYTNIFLMTGGGPGKSTYVPGLELYYNTTQFGRYGYACALGLVLFVFCLVPTAMNMRKKKEG